MLKQPHHVEQQALHWLIRLNNPDLSPEQHQAFFTWLEESPSHQAAFIRAEQAWQSGSVIRDIPQKSNFWFRSGGVYAGLAAACLCLVVIFGVFTQLNKTPLEHYATLKNQQQTIQLSDGSTVVLHSDTEVTFHHANSRRLLHLNRGEAFFEVRKDTRQPFYVVTDKGAVKVIGTQFSVRKLTSDLVITVLEGQVGLLKAYSADPQQTEPKPLTILTQNQQIQLSDAVQGRPPKTTDARIETAWKDGKIVFDGLPLREVIEHINRHLANPIVLASAELEGLEITGVVTLTDPASAAHTLALLTGSQVVHTSSDSAFVLRLNKDN